MVNDLLTIAIEGPAVEDFNCDRAIQLWWERALRQRRPHFVPLAEEEERDGEDELLNYLQGFGL